LYKSEKIKERRKENMKEKRDDENNNETGGDKLRENYIRRRKLKICK
jgi:hypothetical protein